MHNQGKKRHQYIFHQNMLSRDSQSTQLQNSPLPSKQVGGHCSIGMRRIYSGKTIETHSGLSANNLVYMCLHIPTNQLLIHQDIGLLLHQVGHFSPPRSLFLALTLIFAAAVARTMARAPFCQPHIAADHRDMQRLWINYFTGNRTSAAEFFFKKH